jgi:hypothetical protein
MTCSSHIYMMKVHPLTASVSSDTHAIKRFTNMKEWMLSAISLPQFYCMLPVSFWIRPLSMCLSSRTSCKDAVNDAETHLSMFGLHFTAAFEGMLTCLTCCGCCLGKCGSYGPEDVYD